MDGKEHRVRMFDIQGKQRNGKKRIHTKIVQHSRKQEEWSKMNTEKECSTFKEKIGIGRKEYRVKMFDIEGKERNGGKYIIRLFDIQRKDGNGQKRIHS